MSRSRSVLRAAIAAAAVTAMTAAAQAQDGLVVGVDDADVPVKIRQGGVWVDLFDPTATVFGLAANNTSQTIYYNSGSTLYSWTAGGGETLIGTITEVTGASHTMHGLTFNPSDGYLYACTLTANEGVWRIDPATADATLVNDLVDTDFSVSGIAYDAVTGDLWGSNDTGSATVDPGIHEISGAPSFLTAYPVGETDIDGLAAYDGIIYLVDDDPGNFYWIDSTNLAGGYTAFAGPWVNNHSQNGAAFAPWLIPAPGAALTLAFAGLPLTRRRR